MIEAWKKTSRLFIFCSFFLALCAVLMTIHGGAVFGLELPANLLYFIFCGSLCSYNFHWALTPAAAGATGKPAWSAKYRKLHIVLALLSGAAAIYFLFLLPHPEWQILTAFITFLYSAPKIPMTPFRSLKKLAIGKTAFLALGWTHVTFFMPLLIMEASWTPATYLFGLARFYLVYAICVLFDYRDRQADSHEGIRSLVTQLPVAGIRALFMGSLLVSALASLAMLWYGPYGSNALMQLLVLALLLPQFAKVQVPRSEFYFYFFLDGLMALPSMMFLMNPFK